MLGQNLDVKVVKYGLVAIVSFLALIIVLFIKLITGSYFIGIITFVVLVWILIFKIGITIMYPGSSNYYTSDIQIRIGSQLAKNIHHLGHCFQFMAESIVQRKVEFTASQWNLRQKVLGSLHSTIQMLSMFQNNLSERKARILEIFRNLLQQLQSRHSHSSQALNQASTQPLKSIAQFLQHPKKIKTMQGDQHRYLCQRIKSIIQLNSELQSVVASYRPPEKPIDFIKYKFFEEKLYEVRFGYQRWNHMFEYEVHLINNHGYVLECAVIKRNRNEVNNNHRVNNNMASSPASNGKHVLFCNPNGVYIQFFAVENSYIRQYLRQGYQIILWNYRGYGQSTGSPSITKSQTDATKVYNYFTDKGLKIQVVHGYSIGGCAAIGLVHNLQKKQKQNLRQSNHNLRNQNLPNNVKVLIVDRSFSSIGDMAIQFGQTLHKLAKIVFTFQNKNLSKQFIQLKISKLILWDKNDQVIPDSASVKGGILMNVIGVQQQSSCKNCSNCMKHEQQNPLNQQVSVLINQKDDTQVTDITRKFVQKFTNIIRSLLKQSSEIERSGDVELNTNHEYDPSQVMMQENEINKSNNAKSDGLNSTQQIAANILQTLQLIDGGGLFLPSPISHFRKIMISNPISFEYKCNSYIIGLAYYGSIINQQIAYSSRNLIQQHTLKKIDEVIRRFNSMSEEIESKCKIMEPQILIILENMKKIFFDIRSIIQNKFIMAENNNKFGKLISLNSGHNGSLTNEQLRFLMKYIKQASRYNQYENNVVSDGVNEFQMRQNEGTTMQRESNSNTNLMTHNSTAQNARNSAAQYEFQQ